MGTGVATRDMDARSNYDYEHNSSAPTPGNDDGSKQLMNLLKKHSTSKALGQAKIAPDAIQIDGIHSRTFELQKNDK